MEWDKVESSVESWLTKITESFSSGLQILEINPFDSKMAVGTVLTSGIHGLALTLVSLFFVMQFCNDAMYLKLQSYENIFKLVFKFFLAKALVDNSYGLMGIMYNSFTNLAVSVSSSTYSLMDSFNIDAFVTKPDDAGFLNLNNVMELLGAMPSIFITLAATWTISLVLIGRLFEIIIYTTVAPIPLAMFAGEGWTESTKNFLKGYAAVCLQALMIVIMFNAFSGITQLTVTTTIDPVTGAEITKSNFSITVTALALALGISKSGQWSRTAVGMA